MTVPIGEVIQAFDSFVAAEDEYTNLNRLRSLVAQWGQHPASRQAMDIRSMFGVFERHPLPFRELGMPGPLVHAVEAYGQDVGPAAYNGLLADSVGRQPAFYTLWMVNRVCNVAPDPALLMILQDVAASPTVDDALRAEAADFAGYQSGDRP